MLYGLKYFQHFSHFISVSAGKALLGRFVKSSRPALAPWKLLCNMNIMKSGKEGVRGIDDSTINCSKGCELISKS